jgi:hypothetical protein
MRTHLGVNFTVWNRRRTWFWLVLNQQDNGGTIGSAASEEEAIRDACSSIEEMPTPVPPDSALPGCTQGNALMPGLRSGLALGWIDWWISVARRATGRMLTGPLHLMPRSS